MSNQRVKACPRDMCQLRENFHRGVRTLHYRVKVRDEMWQVSDNSTDHQRDTFVLTILQIVWIAKCMNVSRNVHISTHICVIQIIVLVQLWPILSCDTSIWAGVELRMWSMARWLWYGRQCYKRSHHHRYTAVIGHSDAILTWCMFISQTHVC
jgi:hypothetical protein